MTALVRARRLVWEQADNGYLVARFGATSFDDLFYVVWFSERNACWQWVISRDKSDHENVFGWNDAGSQEEAIEACNADRQSRWYADTEVPDLVWESTDDFYFSAIGWGRRYEVVETGGGWWYSFRDAPMARCDSADDGKSACNAHNRELILGATQ